MSIKDYLLAVQSVAPCKRVPYINDAVLDELICRAEEYEDVVDILKSEQRFRFPLATNVRRGSVVITRDCLDIGFVSDSHCGKPVQILGRWSNGAFPMYGGVKTTAWYDTGIRVSLKRWQEIAMVMKDADGFCKYWETIFTMNGALQCFKSN